ncbi:MAG: hypothetical protein IKJ55_05145 [Clostridia bacterium]|nr:hypothetical protein [Clostridia bacterium]
MLDYATVEIYHKQKGKDNKVHEALLYAGACRMWKEKSVREVLGGAENSSQITVLISESLHDIGCGDRCVLNGSHSFAVHKCEVSPESFYAAPLTLLILR